MALRAAFLSSSALIAVCLSCSLIFAASISCEIKLTANAVRVKETNPKAVNLIVFLLEE